MNYFNDRLRVLHSTQPLKSFGHLGAAIINNRMTLNFHQRMRCVQKPYTKDFRSFKLIEKFLYQKRSFGPLKSFGHILFIQSCRLSS